MKNYYESNFYRKVKLPLFYFTRYSREIHTYFLIIVMHDHDNYIRQPVIFKLVLLYVHRYS